MASIVRVELFLPEENLTAFKRVAQEMFPGDEPKEAVQNLIWLFIERIGEKDSWSLFLTGLPLEARDFWSSVARKMQTQFAGISAESAQSMPPNFRAMWEKVAEGGRLTEEDAVAVFIMGGAYGQLQFDGQKVS